MQVREGLVCDWAEGPPGVWECRRCGFHWAGKLAPRVRRCRPKQPQKKKRHGCGGCGKKPKFAKQVWDLAKSLAEFAGDGLRTVDTEEYAARLSVCDGCGERDGARCRVCGCVVALKARGRVWRCPMGKWPGEFQWAAAVTTARRGADYLTGTLKSLAMAGWLRVHVFADVGADPVDSQPWHPSDRWLGPYQNFLRALEALADIYPNADAYAVFQDDILVSRGCRLWLEGQLWPDPLPGVVSLYTAAEIAAGRNDGWFGLDPALLPRKAYGALAYVFPPAHAKKFLSSPPKHGSRTMLDVAVGRWCRENGLPYVQHVPSLVQHVGEVSAITRGPDEQRPRAPRPWTTARHAGDGWVPDVAQLANP